MAPSRSCCSLPPEEKLKPRIKQRQGDALVCSDSTGSLRLKRGALSLRKTQQTEGVNIFTSAPVNLKMMFLLKVPPLALVFLLNVEIA